mgnify:FL=1
MINEGAIRAIQESECISAATAALEKREATNQLIALPDSCSLLSLEKYMSFRRRARGKMRTPALKSFVEYVKAHAENGAVVFVDSKEIGARAVLNLGTPQNPGHADNLALYLPQETAAYAALEGNTGRHLGQKEAAEFIEDWQACIQCLDENGGTLSTSQAVAAVRKITIESISKRANEEMSLSASRSTFENLTATSQEPLPAAIRFTCKPYADASERTFVLRVGVATGESKPRICLRIIKHEEHQAQIAEELAASVEAALNGAMPVLVGSYNTEA